MKTPQPGRAVLHLEQYVLPYRLWQHADLDCAAYPSFFGSLNGYVRLPDEHPQLLDAISEELNAEPHQGAISPDRYDYPGGYDFIETVVAPGGWTYGPDEEGWIGFDTTHAGDIWDPVVAMDMLRRFSLMPGERTYAYIDLISRSFPFVPYGDPYEKRWTPGLVVAEVNGIAEQLAQQKHVHVVELSELL